MRLYYRLSAVPGLCMRRFIPVILSALCASAQSASDEQVPAGLLLIPRSVETVLVADTGSSTLRRFAVSELGLTEIDTRYMSVGRNGVGKERAWDRKTPLGIYFITEELDTERLHDKYGDKAFVLDYPNAWDRYRNRSGDGIWLHGVDRNAPERPALDTDGCLSLPNDAIRELAAGLAPLITPVIVTREIQWADAATVMAQRAELSAALGRWEQSVEHNDAAGYLALYAEDFRYRGMDRAEWAAWRGRVFARREPVRVEIDDLLLLADPEEPGLYLSRFTQRVRTAEGTVQTRKRLYWRHDDAGELRIVTEDNG